MSAETVRTIATVCFVLAALSAALGVFLFFKLKIAEVYRFLTGKQKKIRKKKTDMAISEQMNLGGKKGHYSDKRQIWNPNVGKSTHRKEESSDTGLFGDLTQTALEGTAAMSTGSSSAQITKTESDSLTELEETTVNENDSGNSYAWESSSSPKTDDYEFDFTEAATGLETTVFSDDQTVVDDMVFIHTDEVI